MAKHNQKQYVQKKKVSTQIVPRSWVFSLILAAVVVGASILASATINPLFGRYVHWDWMVGIAPAGFALLTIGFRRRWV